MFSSDDEPELPQPRSPRSPSPSLPALSYTAFRKRSYGESSGNSSDAPCFSSDDLENASISNYISPRPKKQYRRTWYEPETPEAVVRARDGVKRAGKRAKDSGVFMPSSDSSGPEEGFPYAALKASPKFATPPRLKQVISPKRMVPYPESRDLVREIILECLDDNTEVVDIQNMGIEDITGDALEPLHHLIRLPRFQHHPRHEAAYQSFTPQIKLFLAKNLLSRLPSEIVRLQNITMLSLRNNQLVELPHSIGKLKNMTEMNISLNKLRWLPFELLRLVGGEGKLINLTTSLNPWIKATSDQSAIPNAPPLPRSAFGGDFVYLQEQIDELRLDPALDCSTTSSPLLRQLWSLWIRLEVARRRAALPPDTPTRSTWSSDASARVMPHHAWKKDPIYLGSSHITFFDINGTCTLETQRNFPPPSTLPEHITTIPVQRNGPTPLPSDSTNTVQENSAPSLFSLALKSCVDSFTLPENETDLPPGIPEHIGKMLHVGKEALKEGGRSCSVCEKAYIMPAAEWIEYWHCSPDVASLPRPDADDLYLPFLRRSCSWNCARALQEHRLQADVA